MAAQSTADIGGLTRPSGQLDAGTALSPYSGQLGERRAAHLLRRAGFGGSPDEVRRFAAMPASDAVESLMRFPSTANLPQQPDYIFDGATVVQKYGPLRNLSPDELKLARTEIHQGLYRTRVSMQTWWLNRMLQTPAPLQEKMAFFFHGHFTSGLGVKGTSAYEMLGQLQLFRNYALGNLRELTRAVARDPAMLRYLDGAANVAAHPNENFARELMELFTLGVDHYTENDVRESARAWTGWKYGPRIGVRFDPNDHDWGSKTFLGQTGNFNGDDIVNIIYSQPQCSRFLATWLLNGFVYNNPEPELVEGVAAMLRRNDYDLAPVMSTLLRSNVFYSDRAYRALVKSPVEFVVGAHKALGLSKISEDAVPAIASMGQVLLDPPNVAGWPGGENWITSGTLISRQNYLARLIDSQTVADSAWLGQLPMHPRDAAGRLVSALLQGDAAPASVFSVEAMLDGAGTTALAKLSAENFGERVSGAAYLTMSMPAFQLG
ncbi:MAG: DUF1800 domain-containing protein [Candidatus Eremiobacteraeota bacterium]|nr:DUF1800 domain-containing protein [Candidatus Eremiobacteraeota bacterium]